MRHRADISTGSTPVAAQAYARALVAAQSWHGGAEQALALAIQDAPGFVMAHVLQAWLLVCSRDPQRIRSARAVIASTQQLRASDHERLHLAAIADVLADDYRGAIERLDAALERQPRDALALQVANTVDYYTGEAQRMLARVQRVLPAWRRGMPGYGFVLALQAFALEETGQYGAAEEAARAAVELNPLDVRAHHVMAHVFEMTDRADEGARWFGAPPGAGGCAVSHLLTTHCSWHLALFHLTLGQAGQALSLYDGVIRAGLSNDVADLIDASALLWRLHLQGIDTGARGPELARAWEAHIDDAYCTFSDLHAMLAFVAAADWQPARSLESVLVSSQSLPTRHGRTTRDIGLPACRALMAFGRGDDALATTLLASLPALAHRLGGSHAQRDVLHLTLLQAVQYLRRPTQRPRPPIGAHTIRSRRGTPALRGVLATAGAGAGSHVG